MNKDFVVKIFKAEAKFKTPVFNVRFFFHHIKFQCPASLKLSLLFVSQSMDPHPKYFPVQTILASNPKTLPWKVL